MPQPIGHIDMAVIPLDAGRLMVADPAWGARLAGEQLAADPQAVAAFEQSCEQYYFGDPQVTVLYDHESRPIPRPRVSGVTAAAAADTQRIAVHLDTLAKKLGQYGYQVHRVPFLFRPSEEELAAARPGSPPATAPVARPAARDLAYPCLTYNNVLMEVGADGHTVYLPQYGWPAFDQAAAKAWEDAGYRVVRVEGLAVSSMYGGSLRCCAKVLKRAVP